MFLAIFIGTILVILVLGTISAHNKARSLTSAPKGTTRVEAIKAQAVSRTVAEYARAGWEATNQTTAKSFGSQARVTIMFRKTV